DRRAYANRCGEPFERANENRELEIGSGDTMRRSVEARALEHRSPVDQLRRSRLAEPGPPFGDVCLELEEVLRERLLEPGERDLDALRGRVESGTAPARGRRIRVAAAPPLEQPAKRERRDLDRDELRDEAVRRRVVDAVARDDGGPLGTCAEPAHRPLDL